MLLASLALSTGSSNDGLAARMNRQAGIMGQEPLYGASRCGRRIPQEDDQVEPKSQEAEKFHALLAQLLPTFTTETTYHDWGDFAKEGHITISKEVLRKKEDEWKKIGKDLREIAENNSPFPVKQDISIPVAALEQLHEAIIALCNKYNQLYEAHKTQFEKFFNFKFGSPSISVCNKISFTVERILKLWGFKDVHTVVINKNVGRAKGYHAFNVLGDGKTIVDLQGVFFDKKIVELPKNGEDDCTPVHSLVTSKVTMTPKVVNLPSGQHFYTPHGYFQTFASLELTPQQVTRHENDIFERTQHFLKSGKSLGPAYCTECKVNMDVCLHQDNLYYFKDATLKPEVQVKRMVDGDLRWLIYRPNTMFWPGSRVDVFKSDLEGGFTSSRGKLLEHKFIDGDDAWTVKLNNGSEQIVHEYDMELREPTIKEVEDKIIEQKCALNEEYDGGITYRRSINLGKCNLMGGGDYIPNRVNWMVAHLLEDFKTRMEKINISGARRVPVTVHQDDEKVEDSETVTATR